MRRSAKNRSSPGRFILWSALIVVVALLGAGLYGYVWIQGYLKSDAFRAQLAVQLGRAMQADATIDSLTWSGSSMNLPQASLVPKGTQSWKEIGADGIIASLDFSAARDGVWRVTRLSADTLRMDMRSTADIPKTPPVELEETASSSVPRWLRRWIPTRTQVDEVQVQTFEYSPPKGESGVAATGMTIVGKPANDTGAWSLRGEGGKVSLPRTALPPRFNEPLRMTSVSARLDSKALVFHDASARWLGDSTVAARGDVPFDKADAWSFNGSIAGLDLRHLLDAEWNSRLSGKLEGDYEVNPALVKGKVRCKNGIVQNMLVLDTIADFTRTERFRRIVLDSCSGDVERAGGITRVSNINLQCSGLIRVEGGIVIEDDQINGELLVGVAPDTLQWIPGSQDHVFRETRADAPGYVWTTMHVYGPATAPKQDLTNRLLAAAGKALLIDTPLGFAVKGMEILGKSGGVGAEAAKGVINTGSDVIKGTGNAAGKAVETGVDLIKGFIGK